MNTPLSTRELRIKKESRETFGTLPRHPVTCILDNLKSTYNVGIIIRLCESLRLESIYLCGTTPAYFSKKMRKTTRGPEKWIKITHFKSTLETISHLKTKNYEIVAAELTKESHLFHSATYSTPTAFVFGNESRGISQEVLDHCDKSVMIAMYGMGNSINVASSASIILCDAVIKASVIT